MFRYAAAGLLAVTAAGASGQNLFVRAAGGDRPDSARPAGEASFFYVAAPEPRTFRKHDVVYVVIDEQSEASSSSSLETEKTVELEATLDALIDLRNLLTFELRDGDPTPINLIEFDSESTFEGDGTFDRSDRVQAQIAATILEVKPNGALVLEARKTVTTDAEVRTILLSGLARQEDVTQQNTVLSSQLADLRVVMEHEGELRKAAKKGWLTRFLETVFPF